MAPLILTKLGQMKIDKSHFIENHELWGRKPYLTFPVGKRVLGGFTIQTKLFL